MNKPNRPEPELVTIWRDAWRPPDRRPPWAWAEEHVHSIPYSPIPGRFRSENSPQIREPLEAEAVNRLSVGRQEDHRPATGKEIAPPFQN